MQRASNSIGLRRGGPDRSNEQSASRRAELVDRQVELEVVSGQILIAHVLGDPDDRGAWCGVLVEAHALSDRLVVRPQPLRHSLAHDHDLWRVAPILRADPAAAHDARPERGEETRRTGLHREAAELTHRVDAGDVQAWLPERVERYADSATRSLDTGDRLRALEQRLAQGGALNCVELHIPKNGIDPQQLLGVVAEPNGLNVEQAANEQARADEQHHRERRLRHEQRGPERRALDGSFARAGLERRRDVGPSCLKRRREPGQQSGKRRERDGDGNDACVNE